MSEQLLQAQRILVDEVLPAVASGSTGDTVRRLAADLRKLASCWDRATDFDDWDAAEVQRVLSALDPDVVPGPERLTGPAQTRDLQEGGRAKLSAAIPKLRGPADAPAEWSALISYFRARLARDPMTNRIGSPGAPR